MITNYNIGSFDIDEDKSTVTFRPGVYTISEPLTFGLLGGPITGVHYTAMSSLDHSSPLSLREQIEQLARAFVYRYAVNRTLTSDDEDELIMAAVDAHLHVARLTLDAVEAEIRKWQTEGWLTALNDRIAALRAQLTVSPAEDPRCYLCGDPKSKHTKHEADWRTVPGCTGSYFPPLSAEPTP